MGITSEDMDDGIEGGGLYSTVTGLRQNRIYDKGKSSPEY